MCTFTNYNGKAASQLEDVQGQSTHHTMLYSLSRLYQGSTLQVT